MKLKSYSRNRQAGESNFNSKYKYSLIRDRIYVYFTDYIHVN